MSDVALFASLPAISSPSWAMSPSSPLVRGPSSIAVIAATPVCLPVDDAPLFHPFLEQAHLLSGAPDDFNSLAWGGYSDASASGSPVGSDASDPLDEFAVLGDFSSALAAIGEHDMLVPGAEPSPNAEFDACPLAVAPPCPEPMLRNVDAKQEEVPAELPPRRAKVAALDMLYDDDDDDDSSACLDDDGDSSSACPDDDGDDDSSSFCSDDDDDDDDYDEQLSRRAIRRRVSEHHTVEVAKPPAPEPAPIAAVKQPRRGPALSKGRSRSQSNFVLPESLTSRYLDASQKKRGPPVDFFSQQVIDETVAKPEPLFGLPECQCPGLYPQPVIKARTAQVLEYQGLYITTNTAGLINKLVRNASDSLEAAKRKVANTRHGLQLRNAESHLAAVQSEMEWRLKMQTEYEQDLRVLRLEYKRHFAQASEPSDMQMLTDIVRLAHYHTLRYGVNTNALTHF